MALTKHNMPKVESQIGNSKTNFTFEAPTTIVCPTTAM